MVWSDMTRWTNIKDAKGKEKSTTAAWCAFKESCLPLNRLRPLKEHWNDVETTLDVISELKSIQAKMADFKADDVAYLVS